MLSLLVGGELDVAARAVTAFAVRAVSELDADGIGLTHGAGGDDESHGISPGLVQP